MAESSAASRTSQVSLGMPFIALLLVTVVANLNLAVANVALPEIGQAFQTSQTMLNMVAIGYSLGLAASVLYFGALGDRHGRKAMLLLGVGLSIPASLLAAYAPTAEVLVVARIFGGLSAGMAYPTTLALITAIWSGQQRTRAIAMWSAVGGAVMALGPLLSGFLLEYFWWGSVFLVTLPLAVIALPLALREVPAHLNETTETVDHLGGVLSVLMVGTLVVSINFAPDPGAQASAAVLFGLALVCGVLFLVRQRRAANPLYDLHIARRRLFWVAAVAGIIVFGGLMGAMFVGQQFQQNVLGMSTMTAGLTALPAAICMVLVAPQSARLIARFGSRFTLLVGYGFFLVGFLAMLAWSSTTGFWGVSITYAFVGVGAGLAGTPASHSLTGSVPVSRAGMASGTADLQRDLGGAIMQAIQGALLTVGYAAAIGAAVAAAPEPVSQDTESQLQNSFASAEAIAQQYPQYAQQIETAAKQAFLQGANWAYAAAILSVVIGAVIVLFRFPGKQQEAATLRRYAAEDVPSAHVQEAASA